MSTEAQKRASRKYAAANTVQKSLQFNRNTDADIIEYLGTVGNMSGLIKELLRERMAKDGFGVTNETVKPEPVKSEPIKPESAKPKSVKPDPKPDIKEKLKAKGITLL